jgi:hypothetical protein
LTAGRAISATQLTLTTGNLIVASGQGIDFSATAGTGTSELLNDYEEGTWTPVVSGSSTAGTGTYSIQAASYSKIGNRVLFSAYIVYSAHTGTGNMRIGGLPFTIANSNNNYGAVNVFLDGPLALTAGNILQMRTTINSTDLFPGQYLPGGATTSQLALPSTAAIMINGHYYV